MASLDRCLQWNEKQILQEGVAFLEGDISVVFYYLSAFGMGGTIRGDYCIIFSHGTHLMHLWIIWIFLKGYKKRFLKSVL